MYTLLIGPKHVYYASSSMLISGVEIVREYKAQGWMPQETNEVAEALYRQSEFLHSVPVQGRA